MKPVDLFRSESDLHVGLFRQGGSGSNVRSKVVFCYVFGVIACNLHSYSSAARVRVPAKIMNPAVSV